MEISTRIPHFKIKPATEADGPLVLSFIKELAAYVKLPHHVTYLYDVSAVSISDRNLEIDADYMVDDSW